MSATKTAGSDGALGEVPAVAARALTYPLAEACALLGISRRNADRMLAAGQQIHPEIPAVRIGTRWLVQRRALDRVLGIDGAA